jgi:hypothetical protein
MNLIFEKVPRIRWYSDLTPFVAAIASRLHDYTWRFDGVKGVVPPHGKECDDYWVLTGSEFANLVADHPQFTWAVVSAIPKDCSHSQINSPCAIYADGNPAFWTGMPRPQHPFAAFEIVCWDASATLLIGADEPIASVFRIAYPESRDFDYGSADRDRTKP